MSRPGLPAGPKSLKRACFVLGTLAAVLSLAGCGDDKETPYYLGPLDAGAEAGQDAAPTPDSSLSPQTLQTQACTSAVVQGDSLTTTITSLSVLSDRALVTTGQDLRCLQLDTQGCPGAPADNFGTAGVIAKQVQAAALLPGQRVLVGTTQGTSILSFANEALGSCQLEGASVPARLLDVTQSGSALAAFTRSPVTKLTTDLANPGQCSGQSIKLSPEPYAILAVAQSQDGASIFTVEQASASASLQIAKYTPDGTRQAVSAATPYTDDPAHLCSATGLIVTSRGPMVADGTCQRIVLFANEDLTVAADAKLDGAPRGLSLLPSGDKAVVGVVKAVSQGAIGTFLVVGI